MRTVWKALLGTMLLGATGAWAQAQLATEPVQEESPEEVGVPNEAADPHAGHGHAPGEGHGGEAVAPDAQGEQGHEGHDHAAPVDAAGTTGHGAHGDAHATTNPAHGAGAAHDDHGDPASFIIHHVGDSPYYELEIPAPFFTGENPKWDLAKTFAFLRIPLKEGGCPADPAEVGSFGAGCLDLRPTKHVLMMWLAAAVLVIGLLVGSNRNKNQLVPKGTSQNLFEMLVLFVRDEMAVKNIGKADADRYTPFLATAFFFILTMNLLGLVPGMATATGNLAITCGLAICSFLVTQLAGIRSAGLGGYLKHLTGGVPWPLWPIMIPVEVLGLFTKPFALTVRLFANMVAGHLVIFFLLGLIFMFGSPLVAAVSVPFALGIYILELFVAFVQAYVFTMLTSLFIGMSVAMGHHHDHGHEAEAGHGHKEGHAHDHGLAHHVG